MRTLYISADIAKRNFVAAYGNGQRSQVWGEVANQAAGYAELKQWVQSQQQTSQAEVVQLIVEPTGGYEQTRAGGLCPEAKGVIAPSQGYLPGRIG